MNYANYIDHTLLKADATEKDIKRLCKEAKEYEFFSVCVNPMYVKYAKKCLKDSELRFVLLLDSLWGLMMPKLNCWKQKEQ